MNTLHFGWKSIVYTILFAFLALPQIGQAEGKAEQLVQQYLQFYFPAKSQTYYEIKFPWGYYYIDTQDPKGTKVHKDSQPYLGFMTLRPSKPKADDGEVLWTYVVSPDGKVFRRPDDQGIAKMVKRKEITKEGSSTLTVTFRSRSEPVIDDFKRSPKIWKRYGQLKWSKGDSTSVLSR